MPNEFNRRAKLYVRIIDNDLKSSLLIDQEEANVYKQNDVMKAYID